MASRRDALAGAARVVLELRDEARSRGDMTANVGILTVAPGGFNVIPGTAEFTIDARAGDADAFARAEKFVRDTLERVAAEEQLQLEVTETHRKPPTPLDPELQELLAQGAAAEGATARSMPSGAGHEPAIEPWGHPGSPLAGVSAQLPVRATGRRRAERRPGGRS